MKELPACEKLVTGLLNMDRAVQDCIRVFHANVLKTLFKNTYNDDPILVEPAKLTLKDNAKPYVPRCRKYSILEIEFMDNTVKQLLDARCIAVNHEAIWCSPTVIVHDNAGQPKRMVTDLRRVNDMCVPVQWTMPDIQLELMKTSGKNIFTKIDLSKGYWQYPLEEDSGKILSFSTHDSIYQYKRLPQGWLNSVFIFQKLISSIIKSLGIASTVIVWIDDILICAITYDEMIEVLTLICKQFEKQNLRINWDKSVFFATSISYLGRRISQSGVSFELSKINTITSIPNPKYASELMQFINAASFMRSVIPNFATLSHPLHTCLEMVMKQHGKRTKNAMKKVEIHPYWSKDCETAFNNIKELLNRNLELGHFNKNGNIFVFGDASDVGYALLLTQYSDDDEHDKSKPLLERSHKPIGCWSGLWKGSEKRWDISSRELFPFLIALTKYHHFLHRLIPFTICTDNKNLSHILSPGYRSDSSSAITRNRLYRWCLAFMSYKYDVQLIPGETNHFCDLVSRWGQKQLSSSNEQVNNVNAMMASQKDHSGPIFIVDSAMDIKYPTREEVMTAVAQQQSEGVIKNSDGMLEVPDVDNLRLRIFIIAHMYFGGHFGFENTVSTIQQQGYTWITIKQDVKTWCSRCCHCIAAKSERIIKRPWGSTLRGNSPNSVVTMDYLYLGIKEESGLAPYVLVIKDDFSMYTRIHPCESINAEETCRHILQWILLFGPMQILTSDQGSQFTSNLLKELAENYGFRHHIGAVDVHHNMASIERANRQILELFRSIMSELEIPFTDWTAVYDIVQFALNNRISIRLNNKTPLTVFTQLPSRNGFLELLFEHHLGIVTKDEWLGKFHLRISELQKSLEETITEVNHIKNNQSKAASLLRQKQKGVKPITFNIGDWVYIVKHGRQVKSKLEKGAFGPCQIVAQIDPQSKYRWRVKNILLDKYYDVHAEHMLEFAKENEISHTTFHDNETLKNHVARNESGFEVDSIIGHRKHGSGWQLLIHWKGYSKEYDSWEPMEVMNVDIPQLVKKYLKRNRLMRMNNV